MEDKARTLRSRWWLSLIIALSIVPPMVIGSFWIQVLTEILILGMFAISFNLIFGLMGQISFGQGAYYALGAYTTALMLTKTSMAFPLCMVAPIVVSGICALIFGFFIVRLTGIYFAILSLAFAQLVHSVIFQWYDFTGGDNGIQGIPSPILLKNPFWNYYFTLVIVSAALIVMWFITKSSFGYTMRAIRDNSNRTGFVGVNVRKHMLINFAIAGMFAGLGGSLWAVFNHSVSPDLANWTHSGVPIFMTIIGGPSYFLGPLVGSIIYTLLFVFVTPFTEYWPLIIGTLIIFIVLFFSGGIVGTLELKIRPE